RIYCEIDGTPASNDMPGMLVFRTTPAGSATSVERMRINALGNTILANGQRLETDEVRARDSGGLLLQDDGGNLGVQIDDGGAVTTNASVTIDSARLQLDGSTGTIKSDQ